MAIPASIRFKVFLVFLACLLLAILPQISMAQDSEIGNSTVVYGADYFVEYAPITAQHMLDRIPGQGSSGSPRGRSSGGFRGSASPVVVV